MLVLMKFRSAVSLDLTDVTENKWTNKLVKGGTEIEKSIESSNVFQFIKYNNTEIDLNLN